MGAALSVSGLINYGRAVMSFVDQMKNASDTLGMGIENFQLLNVLAQKNGVEMGRMTYFLMRFNTLQGSIDTNKGARKAFFQMGLELSKLKAMKPEDLLVEVARAMDKMSDSDRRVMSSTLFGRGGARFLTTLRDLKRGYKDLKGEFGAALISKEDIDIIHEFGNEIDVLKIKMKSGFAEGALDFWSQLKGFAMGLREFQRTGDPKRGYAVSKDVADFERGKPQVTVKKRNLQFFEQVRAEAFSRNLAQNFLGMNQVAAAAGLKGMNFNLNDLPAEDRQKVVQGAAMRATQDARNWAVQKGRETGEALRGKSFSEKVQTSTFSNSRFGWNWGLKHKDRTAEGIVGAGGDFETLASLALGKGSNISHYEKTVKKQKKRDEKLSELAQRGQDKLDKEAKGGFRAHLTKKERYAMAAMQAKEDDVSTAILKTAEHAKNIDKQLSGLAE